jgi:hypothetical protein
MTHAVKGTCRTAPVATAPLIAAPVLGKKQQLKNSKETAKRGGVSVIEVVEGCVLASQEWSMKETLPMPHSPSLHSHAHSHPCVGKETVGLGDSSKTGVCVCVCVCVC